MATLNINLNAIVENIGILNEFIKKYNIEWSLVVKVLGCHRETLSRLLAADCIKQLHSICVSHIETLKLIKEIDPTIVTLYIKPPVIQNAEKVVRYADISCNSSLPTILALNEAAYKQQVVHKIIIMIEMGELREGVRRESIISFYKNVFSLSNIKVIGLGTNLGCMLGIRPTQDKLIQLVLYQQLLETMFNHPLPLVSGGSSITLPLLKINKVPAGMNHFRVGEAVFLGTSPLNNKNFLNLRTDTFWYDAHIIELDKKENLPDGVISNSAIGHSALQNGLSSIDKPTGYRDFKAILDFGILDVEETLLEPQDKDIRFFGNSSDMTVYSIGDNPKGYKTGGTIRFNPSYMAVAKLMYGRYTEKVIVAR